MMLRVLFAGQASSLPEMGNANLRLLMSALALPSSRQSTKHTPNKTTIAPVTSCRSVRHGSSLPSKVKWKRSEVLQKWSLFG